MGQARWLRKFIRRRMMPIPEDNAHKWKSRFSLAYMLFAWNAMGCVVYAAYTGKLDWADYYGLKSDEEKNMQNNEAFARSIGRPGSQTKLITMRGFTPVETKDFDYENEVLKKELTKPEGDLTLAERIERRQHQLDRIEAEHRRMAEQSKENSQIG